MGTQQDGAARSRQRMGPPLLRIANLSKSFPGLKALDRVGFEVAAGEIVSVVGQNGSGKSTLVKVLAGIHAPDPGAVIEHRDVRFIHQDLGLVPILSTIENLDVSRPLGRRGLLPVRRADERAAARQAIARFGGDFDVRKPVGAITAAERAIVAIARAMSDWSPPEGVLVLDEPTAALGAAEVDLLFEAVRRVAAAGAGVVFISHRLDEVLGLSDRVVALRDGRVVADVRASEIDHERLVELIAGHAVAQADLGHDQAPGSPGPPVLRAHGLVTSTLRGVDLEIREGEILGVSGLLGSGREDLAAVLFGAAARESGTVVVNRRVVLPGDPARSIRGGLAFVPADRLRHGAVMAMSARENLTLPWMRPLRRGLGRLDQDRERAETRRWIDRVSLRPPMPDRPLRLFSGGNQQKVVMAKWLRMEPKVLLLDEPTQGVDVAAKAAIHTLVAQAAAAGSAVLVASTDTEELVSLCDRVLVLREGRVTAELGRRETTEGRLITESLGISGRASDPQPVLD